MPRMGFGGPYAYIQSFGEREYACTCRNDVASGGLHKGLDNIMSKEQKQDIISRRKEMELM
jgi:hypothetical protein